MYVIVGGAGEVGYHVARALRDEGHDVAVVEKDEARLERVQALDVLAIHGNVAQKSLLEEEADVDHADMLIGCTGNDEVNMVACAIAKTHGCRTIARINQTEYLNEPYSREYEGMGIDVAVSPEMVAAIRIRRLLNQTHLTSADVFASGKVLVAEGRVTEDAFVVGKKVGDVEPPEGLRLFAIYRADDVIIPDNQTVFHVHDRLLLALTREEIKDELEDYIGVAKLVRDPAHEVKRIMIDGATRVGIHLARLLEQSRKEVVLVESDEDKAQHAAELLAHTLVVHGDTTQRRLLMQENVDTFDAFVAATGVEEHNVLSAMMAKQLGARVTVCRIEQPELKSFLETQGIDLAVAPRLSTVGAILKHAHPGTEDLELQHNGQERMLTFRVADGSPAAGRTIKRIHFPPHSIVAAIVRGDDVLLPRGKDTVEAGDLVVAYAMSESVQALERLFR